MSDIIRNKDYSPETSLPDKYDKKYFGYLTDIVNRKQAIDVRDALCGGDIKEIEKTIFNIYQSITTQTFLIGMCAHIIEKEKLYKKAGYNSYLEYSQHLFEDLNIPTATLSDAKIIMEHYVGYYKELLRAGFTIERNANKLRFLELALENHRNKDDVFERIANNTFREFKIWAQQPDGYKKAAPEEIIVRVKIDGDKLFVDGINILKFDKALSNKLREAVAADLRETFKARKSGNLPYIVETYDKGEQRAIENFLKKFRAGR